MSSRSLYVRAAVVDRTGTALMRKIEIPTLLVEVPPSVVNLKGYVVAGQVFWHSESKWNVSRCLMCFKENTRLEMMLCDKDQRVINVDVDEVYIAPSHVVRGIKDFKSPINLKQQLAKDQMNLPLVNNTKPILDSFLDHQKKEDMKKKLELLESEVASQKEQNAKLVNRINDLESKIRLNDFDDSMAGPRKKQRVELKVAE
mmetsp:Transcript_35088/g.65004  ORF Transcript_35088/g.65004 Transcript_35088/m.65004 type:complete len:201 (-) Transcript_35088:252-854(-)|eukprot:CAMPEP_0170168680 /NCGR_PEP_ID=MMETSP0040_2-20121228/1618_1 /TAXON_ID=641309 /ORGANISM="Lotharella oceanica, Strain CCMP622" /LENGTH=200 /DNA_ID=CAMNT_0010406983 /DNA_START=1106 /DNA_END=1708 /DNA_ORIENTATION=+